MERNNYLKKRQRLQLLEFYLKQLLGSKTALFFTLNKAGYTATLVTCSWAEAVLEKVTRAFGQEPFAQRAQKHRRSNSRKSVKWSVVPVPC